MCLPILCPDLITEIISFLPVKPVARFKCVSKYYKSLISDPKFVRLHLQKSPKNTHTLITLFDFDEEEAPWVVTPYLVCHLLEHLTSIINEDECLCSNYCTYQAIGSTNGLVCLISTDEDGDNEICTQFWNPTLRLRSKDSPCLTMPPHPNDERLAGVHFGFGYDDSTDTYKVVAVFWDCTTEKWEGRVHCMGDSFWRKTFACPDFPILLGDTLVGPFVNGSVNQRKLSFV